MTRVAVIPLVAAVLAAACASPPPPPPAPDLAAAERGVRAADSAWLAAAAARNPAAEAAVFAANGAAYRDLAEPVVGPAAYQEFMTRYYADNPKSTSSWTTSAITVAAAGDMAVQTGMYTTAGMGAKGDRDERGHFVTIWKADGGQWRVVLDIGQPIPPPAK
jgi:ketosteroid isomerase-like protein